MLLITKLKFSTQKHRFRVNGHKREILFFRNQEDYCVLPWNKRFHNLVLTIIFLNFIYILFNVIGEILSHT